MYRISKVVMLQVVVKQIWRMHVLCTSGTSAPDSHCDFACSQMIPCGLHQRYVHSGAPSEIPTSSPNDVSWSPTTKTPHFVVGFGVGQSDCTWAGAILSLETLAKIPRTTHGFKPLAAFLIGHAARSGSFWHGELEDWWCSGWWWLEHDFYFPIYWG